MQLQPGDVVWADFPGAKETKQRPCVVVSSELYHETRPDVLLAVVTTNIAVATAPTDCVLFDWREAGLSAPSAVRITISPRWQHQVKRDYVWRWMFSRFLRHIARLIRR